MARRRHAAVVLASLIALLVAACGGDEASSSRATLTDDDCTFDGDTAPEAGALSVSVTNRTDARGTFVVFRLADGHTIDDVESDVEQAQRRFDERGGAPPPPPDYFERIEYEIVASGKTRDLQADLPQGTYVVMCFVDDLPTWKAYVTEQLDVSA